MAIRFGRIFAARNSTEDKRKMASTTITGFVGMIER
jgi:hypothetical protein